MTASAAKATVEVPDHFRQRVQEKVAPSERLDSRVHRLDVELSHEKNPRQSDRCQRVEITCYSKGPVIRAEACADDQYGALDVAMDKLLERLRRANDRRHVPHRGRHVPVSVGQATAQLVAETGDVNSYVHIWVYEDAADRSRRRAAMMADPEWQAYLEKNAEAGYLLKQESKLMSPASFAPLRR